MRRERRQAGPSADTDAFMYERIEMNRKSLFNTPIPIRKRMLFRLIRPSFPNTFVEDDHTHHLGDQLMSLTYKMIHAKFMRIDDETVFFGSANLSVFSM